MKLKLQRALLALILLMLVPATVSAGWAEDQAIVRARLQLLPSMIPATHPRVMIHPDELALFRAEFAASNNMMWRLVLKNKVVPLKIEPVLPQEMSTVLRSNDAAATAVWRDAWTQAADNGELAQQFALAYLITGDMWYATQAERIMANLMSWNMSNMTIQSNDEAFIQMLHPLLFAYDWVADVLTPTNKKIIQDGLELRLNAAYSFVRNVLSISDPPTYTGGISHQVRFVSTLAIGGLALYNDTPKAAEVLAWAYEYYVQRFTPWGGDAGGWSEGVAYWNTALTHHIEVAEMFNAIGITALYDQPWFRNTGYFGLYVIPPYYHASIGDSAGFVTGGTTQFSHARRLAHVYNDPYLARYTELIGVSWPTTFSYYNPSVMHTVFSVYRERLQPFPKGKSLLELPQAHWFDDIHWVAIHSNLEKPKDDVFFLMKTSPYGSYSHSHAEQNSFVLNAYGQPLLISAGYREWYGSNHHRNYNRQTYSKNTILVDGKGQQFIATAPGTAITEFFAGKFFTISTGDAATAYASNLLTRFDRRVLAIGGEQFVILDELTAPKESRFDWQLHSRQQMNLTHTSTGLVEIQDGNVKLDVRFLYPQADALSFQQTDKFLVPVDPAYSFANQWHLTVSNKTKAKEQQFLTFLAPYREKDVRPVAPQLVVATGVKGVQSESLRALYAIEAPTQLYTQAGLAFRGRLAAIFSSAGKHAWLLLSGIELFDQERPLVQANAAISVEYARLADNTVWLSLDATQPTQVQIALEQAPQDITIIQSAQGQITWQYDTAKSVLEVNVPAGIWQLSL